VARVLTLNAGSSTLKAHVVVGDRVVDARSAEWSADDRGQVLATALEALRGAAAGLDAVAHRVVHGGERFTSHAILDDAAVEAIEDLGSLAPLHNAAAIEAIRAAREQLPDVPHVACFDTAFHATLPALARRDPIPAAWHALGIRRFGFHGLSVEWAAEQVRARRLVVCHLGGGCSVTAVLEGKSVQTTMGFTPLEGVPMATRSGSVDPGAITYLLRNGLISLEELDHALERESGLLGLSGVSGSVRELEASSDPAAAFALQVFVRNVAAAVAAGATALSGLDALVFTGGVGENSARVRAEVSARLGFLGVELDPGLNAGASVDAEVGRRGTGVRVAVVRSREELVIARATRRLLG